MPESETGQRNSGDLVLPAFGAIEEIRVLAQDELFAVVRDKFPVTPGHTLIIPKRAVVRFVELNAAEKSRLLELVEWAQRKLTTLTPVPLGFNLGVNDGPAAGQTIPQFHFHVIPRRMGDVADPRGGVRWVIPEKANYWNEPPPRPSDGCISALEPIERCTRCLKNPALRKWIHEPCLPVPAFGAVASVRVQIATIGLNPSSTEFFSGALVKPRDSRLAHFNDYGVRTRGELSVHDLDDAAKRRESYFEGTLRPPNNWFKPLDILLSKCRNGLSYANGSAVHLDIVACTTTAKWSKVTDSTSLADNCRDHFDRTVSLLPRETPLLFDGKSACDSIAGLAEERWTDLGRFADSKGKPKTIRVRQGTFRALDGERNFLGWNIPSNYLGNDAMVKIGEWLRTKFDA